MISIENIGENFIEIDKDWWTGCIYDLINEHYINYLHDIYIGVNVSTEIMKFKHKHPNTKTILYNLEHKYPQPEPGILLNCSNEWLEYFKYLMQFIDEVWDFNIENYEYFRDIGCGDKFRFVPLRYTTYFEQFHPKQAPRYDIEFEASIDTQIRKEMLKILTSHINGVLKRIDFKICNVESCNTKYLEKLDARYGLDFPHYDFPETFNCFRIFEYLCLNIQPIVWDPYGVTSNEYFGDLAIYIDDFTTPILYGITRQEPRKDVAQVFKDWTYTPSAFEEYRKRIVMDFVTRTGTQVPDSVLAPVY